MAVRSFAILSVLLSTVLAVLAQPASNPLIPSGISATCTGFLNSFNNDTGFQACTTPFTTALQAFAPGGNATSPSSSAVSSILSALCAGNAFSQCPQSSFTALLANFYAACKGELTDAPNDIVRRLYDVLYSLFPLKQAMCSLDDNGKYCATELSNSSSTGTVAPGNSPGSQQSVLSQYLYITPAANATAVFVPNTTTYQETNLLFMFLQPSMSNSELCTTCTRNIMTPWITFESNCPYGPGLANSLLLAGQTPLYNNITSKCGSNFLSGAVQAAGGISSGLLSGAAPRAGGQELSAAVSAILSVAAFVAVSL